MPDSVEIEYNGEIIASMNSDGSKVLKTGGTIVEHDITVNYTKPAGGPAGNIVNITNNSTGNPEIYGSGLISPNGISVGLTGTTFDTPSGNSQFYLYNNFGIRYETVFGILADIDNYAVVVNNTPLTYEKGGYVFIQTSETAPITGQTYNVVITDKE